MGRDPPPVLPGRLAAEEAPAEEAAEVWVRWAVLRLALLLMVLPLLLPRRRRPWVLRLWQRVLWRLLLGLLLGLLLWLLQAVVRRPKEDRGNVAAGDLGEGSPYGSWISCHHRWSPFAYRLASSSGKIERNHSRTDGWIPAGSGCGISR